MCMCVLSHVLLSDTPWTVGLQAALSMGFPRQEYWRRLPCPPPGHLPDPGIESESLASPPLAGEFLITVPPGKPYQASTVVPSGEPEGTQDENKQDAHHQAPSHCSHPKRHTPRGSRMGNNRMLALDS